jgi:antitoxin ParD1/3/4
MAIFGKDCYLLVKERPMATMNISLPDRMKHWIEERVATGRYANASDYVRDLVREDQDRGRYPQEDEDAIKRALADLGNEGAFVSHEEAMRRLDEAIERGRSR